MFFLLTWFIRLVWLGIFAFLFVYFYFQWCFRYWAVRKVPHLPPKFPLGNCSLNMIRKTHSGNVIQTVYRQMKTRGHRYFGMYFLNTPAFVPIDPQLIRLITSKDFNTFSDRTMFYNEQSDPISAHLLCLNGSKWRFWRAKLTPIFTAGKIKAMFRILIECGQILKQRLQDASERGVTIDAKDFFSDYSTDVIGACAFGMELGQMDTKQLKKMAVDGTAFGPWRTFFVFLGTHFPRIGRLLRWRQQSKECCDFFVDSVRNTVATRELNLDQHSHRKDFMQLLINLKNSNATDPFTIEEMAAQCFIFIAAGFDTSAITMSFATYEIARNPDIEQRLRDEIHRVLDKYDNNVNYDALTEMIYLQQVIDETLRMYSPAYYVTRKCMKDYPIPDSDLVLKKGTHVVLPIRSLHYDEDYYPDPLRFDPERFSKENKQNIQPFTYLPFGEGPRNCIGMRFGLIETKVALINLFTQYRFRVNKRTLEPIRFSPATLLLDPVGGIWLDVEKIA